MRFCFVLFLMAGVHAAAETDLNPPQARAVDEFMGMVTARLGPGQDQVAADLRLRLETLTRAVARAGSKARFTAHFGFWPRPSIPERIEYLANDYLTALDRAFTARETGLPQTEINRHVARALRAVGEAHAWSTSTVDVFARPTRGGLIRRYLAEAAIVWGSIVTIAGAEISNGRTPNLITGGIMALAAVVQNLNFWWTGRTSPPPLPPTTHAARSRDRRNLFWQTLANFYGSAGPPQDRSPAELEAFAEEQFDWLADLGQGLTKPCERLLAGKLSKDRQR